MPPIRKLTCLTLVMALVAAVGTATPAAAKNPAAASNSSGNSGNSGNAEKSQPPGQAKKDTPPPGQAKKDRLPDTDVDAAIVLPQVSSNAALSLAELRVAVARLSKGRLLDVEMVRIGKKWAYDVTVLEAGNVTRHVLVDAQTGRAVER
jgi:uncharacterized membrane protein YkoI